MVFVLPGIREQELKCIRRNVESARKKREGTALREREYFKKYLKGRVIINFDRNKNL